jgi:hypothetical protein
VENIPVQNIQSVGNIPVQNIQSVGIFQSKNIQSAENIQSVGIFQSKNIQSAGIFQYKTNHLRRITVALHLGGLKERRTKGPAPRHVFDGPLTHAKSPVCRERGGVEGGGDKTQILKIKIKTCQTKKKKFAKRIWPQR